MLCPSPRGSSGLVQALCSPDPDRGAKGTLSNAPTFPAMTRRTSKLLISETSGGEERSRNVLKSQQSLLRPGLVIEGTLAPTAVCWPACSPAGLPLSGMSVCDSGAQCGLSSLACLLHWSVVWSSHPEGQLLVPSVSQKVSVHWLWWRLYGMEKRDDGCALQIYEYLYKTQRQEWVIARDWSQILLQMCAYLYSGMKMGVLLSVIFHSMPAEVPLYTAALRAQTCLHSLTQCFSTHRTLGSPWNTFWEAVKADENKQACTYLQQSLCLMFLEEAFCKQDWLLPPPLGCLLGVCLCSLCPCLVRRTWQNGDLHNSKCLPAFKKIIKNSKGKLFWIETNC